MSDKSITPYQPETLATIPGLPVRPLEDLDAVAEAFRELRKRVHLLCPSLNVSALLPMSRVAFPAVWIDPSLGPTGSGPQVYRDPRFCGDGEVALGKNALMALMSAGAVQLVEVRRVDDASDPSYCHVQVEIASRNFDGTWARMKASKELDLRDGAPETLVPERDAQRRKTGAMVALSASALADKRRHILSLCETKALTRALRALFALPQKFTIDELSKPFVIPRLVPDLDPADPDVRRALISMHLSPAPSASTVAPPQLLPSGAAAPALPEFADVVVAPPAPDDLDDPPPPPTRPPPSPNACACPCGCEEDVQDATRQKSIEFVGAVRCAACYPGSGFDELRHRDLRSLGLPKYPNLTMDEALQWVAQRRQRVGKA